MLRTRMGVALIAALGAATAVLPVPPAAAQAPATESSGSYVRGVYGRDSSPTGLSLIDGAGFDTVTVQPWKDHLDRVAAAGMKGVVWLWGYNNATCSFEESDAYVREVVGAIKGHPAIAAYQVADEPNYATVQSNCPNVPAQIKARSDLIKSVDPTKPTYVVISIWDGRELFPFQYFRGTTDIMGIDVYPCVVGRPVCEMDLIDKAIAAADADGIERYWGILQDFDDGYYRHSTAAELDEQFDRWSRSRMEGYFVYHWNFGDVEAKPDHLATFARRNATMGPAPAANPSPVVEPPSSDEAVAPDGAVPTARADVEPPTAPGPIFAVPTKTGTELYWSAAADDTGVAGYAVWRDGRPLAETRDTAFTDDTTRRTSYVYSVKAFDEAGNFSEARTITVSTWRRKGNGRTRFCALWTIRRPGSC